MEKLETQLRNFYARYLPNKSQQNINEIARKYLGKEKKLFAYLHKKYADEIAEAKTIEREELNFRSKLFNANKALLSNAIISVPVPDAVPMDNLHKCRTILPINDENYDGRIIVGPIDKKLVEEKYDRKSTTSSMKTKIRKDKLSSIADCFQVGPMSLLRRCFRNQRRICVRTRAINGERGQIVGSLDAFDKHMNMILRNAVETYRVNILGQDLIQAVSNGYHLPPLLKYKSLNDDELYCIPVIRKFRNLLVRGDMVMLVYEEGEKKT